MKNENLHLPSQLDGKFWKYASRGNEGRVFQEHMHEELEVNIVTSGYANYLILGKRYKMVPGTQVWLFPEHPHLLLEKSNDFEMVIVVFKKKLLKRLVAQGADRVLISKKYDQPFVKEHSERERIELFKMCKMGIECDHDRALYNSALAFTCLKAWELFKRGAQPNKQVNVSVDIQQCLKLIESTQFISLNSLAEKLKLSPSQLSRQFQAQVGLKLSTYKQNIYLERFMKMWTENCDLNFLQGALKAGFGSYAQFHRVFKEKYGCGPASYKREYIQT